MEETAPRVSHRFISCDEEHRSILNTDIGIVCVCSMEGPTVEATCLLGYLHQFHPSRRYALADFYYALIRWPPQRYRH